MPTLKRLWVSWLVAMVEGTGTGREGVASVCLLVGEHSAVAASSHAGSVPPEALLVNQCHLPEMSL